MRILYIAPGDNPHTWKWAGWFGKKYQGEVFLLPYISMPSENLMPGVNIIEPPIPEFRIASLRTWLEAGRVRRVVEEVRPQILHVLWAYGLGFYGVRSGFHPFVISPWGSDITLYARRPGIKGRIQRILVAGALTSADRVTATSRFLADAISSVVPGRPAADLFPYGVDTSMFDPAQVVEPLNFGWEAGTGQVTIGFFKRLERTYGPDILLRAAAAVLREFPGARLVISGEGSMSGELRRTAGRLGILDRVCFPGRIPWRDMPKALAAVDIFVMPSRFEALGVAALEASAMCRPVVASGEGGVSEVVQDGITGYLVGVGDVSGMAERILELASDSSLRARMGEKGRKFVMDNFDHESIMLRADRYYSELLGEISGGGS